MLAKMDILINKTQKILSVPDKDWCFPIGIGKDPIGTKLVEGDHKTPEGEYLVCVKNPKSDYFLSLWLNYPNMLDAKRGLEAGLIDEMTFNNIISAHEEDRLVPWDTPLGGKIYIHGHLEVRDWSQGCVRLYNEDMLKLYHAASVGDRVYIAA